MALFLEGPALLEADHVSVTVAWRRIAEAKQYELQMSESDENGSEIEWVTLSNKLKANQARKKNLTAEKSFRFRVRYLLDVTGDVETWSEFSDRSEVFKVVPATVIIPNTPTIVSSDSNSITLSWEGIEGIDKYRLRYRTADSVECKSITLS